MLPIWFWELLGWQYYKFGKNCLWLKGCRLVDLAPSTTYMMKQQGAVPVRFTFRIRSN